VRVFVSDYVLGEVRALPAKLPARLGVTPEKVEQLVLDLGKYSELVENVPAEFHYERDPADAPYVDLAHVAQARFLVTRDKDLLDLMKDAEFRRRFPMLEVVEPPLFLGVVEAEFGTPRRTAPDR
jgi:putative PIN family toxin of toxin-antitoxin system